MADIIVADDEEAVRTFITRYLEQAGHHVIAARDGTEVLSIIESQNVDAVILDILMPEKEGLETLIELRQRGKAFPIITISGGSGSQNSDYLELSEKLGANCSLQKPFSGEALVTALGQLLLQTKDSAEEPA
ncbi:response regulator transcription factor [Fodinicurvata fenggangensis]|uniref:response regulator transcription factor n=1 Tax=Fodinicurvata fenggangensis TaxID=1121830 RepID=UPI00047C5C14|nr:response regulator [Fodinicurvata fenggangensis]